MGGKRPAEGSETPAPRSPSRMDTVAAGDMVQRLEFPGVLIASAASDTRRNSDAHADPVAVRASRNYFSSLPQSLPGNDRTPATAEATGLVLIPDEVLMRDVLALASAAADPHLFSLPDEEVFGDGVRALAATPPRLCRPCVVRLGAAACFRFPHHYNFEQRGWAGQAGGADRGASAHAAIWRNSQ